MTPTLPTPWKTRSSRLVYENQKMKVREDLVELPDGRSAACGVVTFSPCVGVVPFLDAGHILLVRQYRHVQRENFRWEIPTGAVEPGESIEAAAQRELREETGYRAGALNWLNTNYTSKSACAETAHLFLGERLELAPLPLDDTEQIQLRAFPFEGVVQMVLRSEILDSMSIIGILCAARLRGL